MKEERYPEYVREFLIKNNAGKSAREITELLNSTFGTDYTAKGIKGLRARMHLVSGLTGHFEKGHIPANKGKKGYCAPGSEKGWFKKGQIPHNHVPVGTEVMTTDGYLKIKIAEPKQWRFKHIMEWEKYNGKVPEGCMISFKDGDHYNCSIENLMCITKAENAILNHQKLRAESAEQTETAVILAKLQHKIYQAKAKGEQSK